MCVCSGVLVCITKQHNKPQIKMKEILWAVSQHHFYGSYNLKFRKILSLFFIHTHLRSCSRMFKSSARFWIHKCSYILITRNDILVSKLFQAPKACHMSFCFPDTQAHIHILDICISSLDIESLTSIPDQQYCLHILL